MHLLRVFLQVHVLDPLAEDWHPVLGELVMHDVASIEMDLHMLVAKTIDKLDHFLRAEEVTVGEYVLDVKEQELNNLPI